MNKDEIMFGANTSSEINVRRGNTCDTDLLSAHTSLCGCVYETQKAVSVAKSTINLFPSREAKKISFGDALFTVRMDGRNREVVIPFKLINEGTISGVCEEILRKVGV